MSGVTANCPSFSRCESCGLESDRVAVGVVHFPRLGEACLSLCPACAASGVTPPVTAETAARLVAQHVRHDVPGGGQQ
jgi:hypothetical protein